MKDEMIAAVALVVGVFVATTTYRKTKNKKSKKQVFIEKAKKAGHYTVGKLEKTKVYPGILDSSNPRLRHDSVEATYQYTVNGINYYKKIMFQNQDHVGTDYPMSVTVYYDPAKPKMAICPEEAHASSEIQPGCLKTIAITAISMFATFHIIRLLLG